MSDSPQKKAPDWEIGERLYRAGQLSLRQVAEQIGCTEGAVRKRAKLKGWDRDLTHRVREQVRAAVVRDQVREVRKEAESAPISDEEIIEGATAATLLALNSHNHTIGRLKEIGASLLAELAEQNVERETSLAVRADVLKKLTESSARLIVLEREALMGDDSGTIEDWLRANDA